MLTNVKCLGQEGRALIASSLLFESSSDRSSSDRRRRDQAMDAQKGDGPNSIAVPKDQDEDRSRPPNPWRSIRTCCPLVGPRELSFRRREDKNCCTWGASAAQPRRPPRPPGTTPPPAAVSGTLFATRLRSDGRGHKGPGRRPAHDPPCGGPSGAGRCQSPVCASPAAGRACKNACQSQRRGLTPWGSYSQASWAVWAAARARRAVCHRRMSRRRIMATRAIFFARRPPRATKRL